VRAADERGVFCVEIGEKIKRLRVLNGLTQEELALRCDLSKGFISQLERDLASPSIATLKDILECLGTDLRGFFNEREDEKIVFGKDDIFDSSNEEYGTLVQWLIPNAQKNSMEPILLTIAPGGATALHDPHEGEEFGYVLLGGVVLVIGEKEHKVRKGESFCFHPKAPHQLRNPYKKPATLLWVSSPPSF
jgi:transcriptional regulator with XRE-family HTH domain